MSGNEIMKSIKGRNSVTNLQKLTSNNPNLDLVNIGLHTKFGSILSIHSQDIEQKNKYPKGNDRSPDSKSSNILNILE